MNNIVESDTLEWWKNFTESYVIRELTIQDITQITSLIRKKPFFWKTLELSENDLDNYVRFYLQKFEDPGRWKCVGAFLDNILVMETSAFFPLRANHWYSTSLRHDSDKNSLHSGALQRYLFADCFTKLIDHGEKLGKFSFYAMRSVSHQRVINRMWDKTRPGSPLSKYDYYIDGFVRANSYTDNVLYEIFFPDKKTYNIDLVVYLHCLKQSHRLTLLRDNFNFQH